MQKPWNIPDLPVFSLATYADGMVNMNICTYVTKVSMSPGIYVIAVYEDTKTLENISTSDIAVLQLLHEEQHGLVRLLGKKSGKVVNKEANLSSKNHLEIWEGQKVLKNVSARILLQKTWSQTTGDHTLFAFKILKSKSYAKEYLTTRLLSTLKIISI